MAYAAAEAEIIQPHYESELINFPVATGETFYKGNAVFVSIGTATNTPVEGAVFVGVASNTGGETVHLDTTGVFPFKQTGLDEGDLGSFAFIDMATDNGTIVKSVVSGVSMKIGVIVAVYTGFALVRIDGFACSEAATTIIPQVDNG